MIRPVTTLRERPRRVKPRFVLAELLLVVAVPLLGIVGLQTLLSSRAGVFVEEAGPDDPGYRALVEPSPVTAVVEITNKQLTGMVIVAQPGAGGTGGGLLLVPAELVIDDVPLRSLPVEDAVAAVERGLHLSIGVIEAVEEERWSDIVGSEILEVDNPDPVTDTNGAVIIDVGPVTLDAAQIGPALGLANVDVDPRSLLFRRSVVWQALLDDHASESRDPVGALIEQVAAGATRIEMVPLVNDRGVLRLDQRATEELILEMVPFPTGAEPGDRVRVRLLDQVGGTDLLGLAGELAGKGYEVIEVGNMATFVEPEEATNRLLVPIGLEDPRLSLLADEVGADTLESNEIDADVDGVVTLLVGP